MVRTRQPLRCLETFDKMFQYRFVADVLENCCTDREAEFPWKRYRGDFPLLHQVICKTLRQDGY